MLKKTLEKYDHFNSQYAQLRMATVRNVGVFMAVGVSPALPGDTVHSLLIGGWDQEADGGDHRLTALVVEHPPLMGLGVIQQGTLIAPVDRDLGGRKGQQQQQQQRSTP